MIIESVLNLFANALKLIFDWISLPSVPAEVTAIIDQFYGYLRAGMGFVFLWFNMDLVKIMLPLLIAVINFDKVYRLIMFVLRKIPFLGIG